MRTLTTGQLKTILDSHARWLVDSTKGERADLRYANLSDADLRYANLSYADLRGADLSYADLRYVNLSCADLSDANLRRADLSDANLRCANLRCADFRFANLRYANLSNSNLRFADLKYSDLRFADLSDTNILIFQFNKHQAIYTHGSLTIGCHCLPITKWAETYKDIGFNEGYSDEEIAAYGVFINLCYDLFKKQTSQS